MHYNDKLDEQAITNIIKRHIKPMKRQKQIKLTIDHIEFQTSYLIGKNIIDSTKIHWNRTNVVYKFICPFRECLTKNTNNSYIGYTATTLSRQRLQILDAICIKTFKKTNINKIAFNTGSNILNIFNN